MTEDEILELGTFCTTVLSHPLFERVVSEFEKTTCANLLGTKPGEKEAREHVYATFLGAQTFIGYMHEFVAQSRKIMEANDPQAAIDDDAAIEDIDY